MLYAIAKNPFLNIFYLIKLIFRISIIVFKKIKKPSLLNIAFFSKKKISNNFYNSESGGEYINELIIKRNINKPYQYDEWYDDLPSSEYKLFNLKNIHKVYLSNLAGLEHKFTNKINWKQKFEDTEDTMSLNRFDWLLQLLSKNKELNLLSKGLSWIIDWIENNNKIINDDLAWDSYTSSERITNIILFLCLSKKNFSITKNEKEIIYNSLRLQSVNLAKNLDFWGVKTNNHIINNARALFISGLVLKIKNLRNIGYIILKRETEKLIPDGVLNEGSTHYQFLVTRTYFEVYWFAKKYKDEKMINWVKPQLRKMIDTCHFISNNNPIIMPLVGDISPDYPPSWFMGYPFTNNSIELNKMSNWSKLWGDFKSFYKYLSEDNLIVNKKNNTENYLIKKNQWLKYNKDRFLLFMRFHKREITSHYHQDYGSFNLYFKTIPILIDPGLYKYTWRDPLVRNQSEANHHSTITLNGVGLIPSKLSQLNKINLSHAKNNSLEKKTKGFKCNYVGFRASGRWVKWTREFLINDNKISIFDNISNKDNEKVKLNFILNNQLKIKMNKKSEIIINNEKIKLRIDVPNNDNSFLYKKIKLKEGLFSNEYGRLGKCKIVEIFIKKKPESTIVTNINVLK